MKRLFCLGIILVLFVSILSESKAEEESGYDEMVHAFEKTKATFEGYNVNGHAQMEDTFLNFENMEKIASDLNKSFGINEKNVAYTKTEEKNFRQVYAYGKNEENKGVSIIVESERCENVEQTHIIVDINKNEVYKDIVETYAKMKNELSEYDEDLDIYTCITGSFEGKLNNESYDKIMKRVFLNMNGVEKERIEDENLISVTGYSNKLKEYIKYGGNKVNLNASLRYSEYDNKTFVYIGTPLIILEY